MLASCLKIIVLLPVSGFILISIVLYPTILKMVSLCIIFFIYENETEFVKRGMANQTIKLYGADRMEDFESVSTF